MDAVNVFSAKVAMEKSIPFELKLSSEELENRTKNLEKDKNAKTYSNSKELFEDLGI